MAWCSLRPARTPDPWCSVAPIAWRSAPDTRCCDPERASDGEAPQYLVHTVRANGGVAIAYFELAPEWLWQDREDMAAAPSVLAVYDEHGRLLSASDELPVDVWRMFAHEHSGQQGARVDDRTAILDRAPAGVARRRRRGAAR